ncbi:hypothetical protein DNTS_025152 [Danionella cerebrum]|uniref:Peflin n=1 Tax=Danionella cerebrum TaxID=2873325 RepID=A0A553R8M2_9TELE|nr:hypothetical protein DNTS_025152 [Danionella translucida]
MSYQYGQGYPGPGGNAPQWQQPSGYGGGPVRGQYGSPYGSAPPGQQHGVGGPYGYGQPGPRAPYGGGQAPGGPYVGYGHPQGGPYGQQGPTGNIPPGVSVEAYQWFSSVDGDQSGYINVKELKQALMNFNNSSFNDETCIMMLNMFDKTKSGRVDVFGFSALWTFLQQWRAAFQQFDRDRSGSINSSEMHQALSQMGYNLSPQFIQELVNRYSGRSVNGVLQLDRFIQVCTQLQSMTLAFREKDAGMTGNVRMSYEEFLAAAVTRLM